MALLNSMALVILIASFCMSQINPCNSLKVGDNIEKEVVLPRRMAHRLSPLSSSAISHYTTFLKDGTFALHAADFCKASGITCNDKSNPQIVHPLINNGWNNGYGNLNKAHSGIANTNRPTFDQEVRELRNKHFYFREKELVVGGQILVSSLVNVVPPRPFLPQAIAASLPFSTSLLPHLTQLLGISTDSYLYKSMAISLEECETKRVGEKKMCATSMEDMLQFAMSSVLQKTSGRLQILSSEGASTKFPQTPTLQQVALKVLPEKPSLLCHALMFPFALYSCHQIPHTKVYQASWTASHKLIRAVAVCHMNTSGFDANHPAFASLYMKPGDGEVCHWVDEDDLVMWEANE